MDHHTVQIRHGKLPIRPAGCILGQIVRIVAAFNERQGKLVPWALQFYDRKMQFEE